MFRIEITLKNIFFVLITIKMFKIYPHKIFSMLFVLIKLKCIVFLLVGTRFRNPNLSALLFYNGYMHNQYTKITFYICYMHSRYKKNIIFTLIICITDIKSHRRFRFIRTYIRVKKWYISFYDKEKYTEILKEWILNIFIFAYLRGRNTFLYRLYI